MAASAGKIGDVDRNDRRWQGKCIGNGRENVSTAGKIADVAGYGSAKMYRRRQTISREDVREEADNADDIYRQGRCVGREDISAGKKIFGKIFGRENIPENISPKIGSRAMGRRCIVCRVNRQR